MRIRVLGIVAGVTCGLSILGSTAWLVGRADRVSAPSAAETLLTRRNQELLRLTSEAEKGTLLDFDGVLVVVEESLVQNLLRAVTPMEADVGGGFRVRIESVETDFGDGVALVRFDGSARLSGAAIGVPVTVLGALDHVEIDRQSGILHCDIGILGVEAQNASALGRHDPVDRLTEVLTEGGLSLLLGGLEIPVRLEDRLRIPEVASKRLRIAASDLPLRVDARRIKVFNGKLWVFVDVALSSRRPAIGPTS